MGFLLTHGCPNRRGQLAIPTYLTSYNTGEGTCNLDIGTSREKLETAEGLDFPSSVGQGEGVLSRSHAAWLSQGSLCVRVEGHRAGSAVAVLLDNQKPSFTLQVQHSDVMGRPHLVLFFFFLVPNSGSNSGPCVCEAGAAPLSQVPSPGKSWFGTCQSGDQWVLLRQGDSRVSKSGCIL